MATMRILEIVNHVVEKVSYIKPHGQTTNNIVSSIYHHEYGQRKGRMSVRDFSLYVLSAIRMEDNRGVYSVIASLHNDSDGIAAGLIQDLQDAPSWRGSASVKAGITENINNLKELNGVSIGDRIEL